MKLLNRERLRSGNLTPIYKKLGGDVLDIAARREAILARQEVINNDALAPVYILLKNENGDIATEHQIWREFVTDISERSQQGNEKPFDTKFGYRLTHDGDYLADTGESLREILATGVQTALLDALEDPELAYGVELARAYETHLATIRQWHLSNETKPLILASLCPPENELPSHIAKKLSRKPDRLMASIWVFEKNQDTLAVKAISLDNFGLKDLAALKDAGIITGDVVGTTLEQIRQPLVINGQLTADRAANTVRQAHDLSLYKKTGLNHHYGIQRRDEAADTITSNSLIESKPEAYRLYRSVIGEVKDSLLLGEVTPELRFELSNLADPFSNSSDLPEALRIGQSIDVIKARALLEYLRSRAIPHYLYDSEFTNKTGSENDGGLSIARAGAAAEKQGISYTGDCQTSVVSTQSAETVAETYKLSSNVEYLECVTCPFCGKLVTAKKVRSANTIQCMRSDCGAILNTKTGKRIDAKFLKNEKAMSFGDLLVRLIYGTKEDRKAKHLAQIQRKAAKANRRQR